MSVLLDKPKKLNKPFWVDRPAWIPDDITENWDTCPYAYQTEEELMPAGGNHGRLLSHIMALISHLIEPRGFMFLLDTFMLYRDENGVKRRIAPDLLLMPYREDAPSAYDLDVEPPPLMVVEVTSPNSHVNDLEEKVVFYGGFDIPTYLVVDAITPSSKLREQIDLYLWRMSDAQLQRVDADPDGYYQLPELGLGVMAEKRELIFKDSESGEIARDAGQLSKTLERQQRTVEEQTKALEAEREAKEAEREARIKVEQENAELRAELERLRREQGK